MANKKTPEINASSTADIAFLLLTFFLMSTTMDVDSGLFRRLPPMPPKDQVIAPPVAKRNILQVFGKQERFAGCERKLNANN